jgi:hypothetical protein
MLPATDAVFTAPSAVLGMNSFVLPLPVVAENEPAMTAELPVPSEFSFR